GEPVSIHELFEQQAERSPEAVAVECGQTKITYAELNGRANRLAEELRKLGVGPEVRVALWMERGLNLVVALLGILKAGGAYVPLDPNYPAQRLQFMLTDSDAAVLIVEERVQSTVGSFHGPILRMDQEEFARKGELAGNLPTL